MVLAVQGALLAAAGAEAGVGATAWRSLLLPSDGHRSLK